MSIQNKRIARVTADLLRENLQQGILPDAKEFVWQFNQRMQRENYAKPSFQFRPYRNTEVASSAKYNEDNRAIYNDLLALYQNIVTVHQLLNRHHQNFSLEKEKIEKTIDILENRLKQAVQNARRGGFLAYTYETFDTTDRIDLDATTDIFVDTKDNVAHLVEEKSTSRRVIPKGNAAFLFEPAGADKKERLITGTLDNILADAQDRIWQKEFLMKENQSVQGTLTLSFVHPTPVNQLSLDLLTVKPTAVKVEYTPDGTNWYALPQQPDEVLCSKRVSLYFSSVTMQACRLVLTKKEADDVLSEKDDYDYQYLFGLEHLAFYQKAYPTTGTLMTKAYPLQNRPAHYAIDRVQLLADEWVPTGTDIRYAIALEQDGDLDWQPLAPRDRKNPADPTQLHFSQLTRNVQQDLYFKDDYALRQAEATDLLTNGVPIYRLSAYVNNTDTFQLPPVAMVEGTTRLYVGRNTWEVTAFPSDDVYGLPDITDFQTVHDQTTTVYRPLLDGQSGTLFKNETDTQQKKYLARIGFYLTEAQTLQAIPVSTEPLSVFVNGDSVFKGHSSQPIHYVFKAGWNEIVVLVNGEHATTVNGMSVNLGFNPKKLTETIYASSDPLREVSVFDLQYNTKMNDHTVFARRETERGLEILTNFGQPGLHFDLFYDYKEDDFSETQGVYLRAEFRRDNGETIPTPLLRQVRLEFS